MIFSGALLLLHFFALPISVAGEAPRPLVSYSFTYESCQEGLFPAVTSEEVTTEATFPPLRDSSSTRCSDDLGVESVSSITTATTTHAPVLSLSNVGTDKILRHVREKGQGISFEFWVKSVGSETNDPATIFTVGAHDEPPINGAQTVCERDHYDLRLVEIGSELQVTYMSSDPFFFPCYKSAIFSSQVQRGKLLHIVLSLEEGHQQVFLNGNNMTLGTEQFSDDLQHWSSSFMMNFFNFLGQQDRQSRLWNGKIYQFSIYDHALSEEEVEASLVAGLPPGRPYSISYQIAINEDAEAVPESHEPEWYLTPPMPTTDNLDMINDLQRVPLRTGSMLDEVEDLLSSVNLTMIPSSSNMMNYTLPFFFITGFPSKGQLFQISGNQVTEVQPPPIEADEASFVILVGDPAGLVFLPPFNEHSEMDGEEFTQMQYCVSDRIIFDSSQCESATIAIVVNPVNDPPAAVLKSMTFIAWEGLDSDLESPSIKLSGSDVDIYDTISSIQITQPPKWGKLILRVTSFRADGVMHGAYISENITIPTFDSQSIHVRYIFDRPSPDLPQQVIPGNDAFDMFLFRVSDNRGVWSPRQSIQVHVSSALEAKPLDDSVILRNDDTDTTVTMNGIDHSGYQRTLAFFIQAVPSEEEGVWLKDAVSDEALRVGSILPAINASTSLKVQSSPYFCNASQAVPLLNFTYRAVAIEFGRVVSTSPIVTQSLARECQIYANIDLNVPTNVLSLTKFGLGSTTKEICQDIAYGSYNSSTPPLTLCPSIVMLEGINVTISGGGIDKVRVSVLPGKGYITFNNRHWSKVDPINGRPNMASKNVKFSASPQDLTEIFDGLLFRSEESGTDRIEITIQYGDCSQGDKVSESQGNAKVRVSGSDCSIVTGFIHVNVKDGGIDSVLHLTRLPFPWQAIFSWFGYPLLYLLFSSWKGVSGSGKEESKVNPRKRGKAQATTKVKNDPCNDWVEHHDREGVVYFQNVKNGRKTYWAQYYDPYQTPYYANNKDGTVTFSPPSPSEEFAPRDPIT